MLGPWRARVDEVLADSLLAREGWISAGALRRAWQTARATGVVHQQLWYVYVLELWFRHEASPGAFNGPVLEVSASPAAA